MSPDLYRRPTRADLTAWNAAQTRARTAYHDKFCIGCGAVVPSHAHYCKPCGAKERRRTRRKK